MTCDGCGKKFLIEQALSCPNGGLVLARHDNAKKEWGVLGGRVLVPSAITYESKINSRTVQGERIRAGARKKRGETETVGEAQWSRVRMFNRTARLVL